MDGRARGFATLNPSSPKPRHRETHRPRRSSPAVSVPDAHAYIACHAVRRSRLSRRSAGRPRGWPPQPPAGRDLAVRRRIHGPGDDRAGRGHPPHRLRPFDHGMGAVRRHAAADERRGMAAAVPPLPADSAIRPGERRLRPRRLQADLLAGMDPSAVGPADRTGLHRAADLVLGERHGSNAGCARVSRCCSCWADCKERSAGSWWHPASSPTRPPCRRTGW